MAMTETYTTETYRGVTRGFILAQSYMTVNQGIRGSETQK